MNKRIFNVDINLKLDRIMLQNSLDSLRQILYCKTPEEEIQWIVRAIAIAPSFLNLEQSKRSCVTIDTVVNDKGIHTSTESILTAITDFYAMLYSCQDSQTEDRINDFLDSIPSLSKISCDASLLIMSISQEEVAEAIKSLRPGKAPGCDSLTSEF